MTRDRGWADGPVDPRLRPRRPPRDDAYDDPDPSPLPPPRGADPSPEPGTPHAGGRARLVPSTEATPPARRPATRRPPYADSVPKARLGGEQPDRRDERGRVGTGDVPRRQIAAVAGVSAVGTLLSRVTGLGRTLTTAFALGANGVSDAYNLANTTPNIIYDLLIGGMLAGTMVPVFVQALNQPDEERGWEAISAVCTAVAAVLLVVSVVFFAAAPLLIYLFTITSHSPQIASERKLAVSLLYLFVPQLFFYGMAAVATALLQARRRYAAPMYTPVLNNLIVIAVLITFAVTIGTHFTPAGVLHHHGAVLLLGLGTTAGVVVLAVALVPALRAAGVRLRLAWNPRHPAVRRILRLSSWMFGVTVANQIAYFVVILLANHRAGDYSAYSYAYIFMQLPYGVWTVSVMGPMETEVAHAWQAGDLAAARRELVEAIWLVAVIIIPAGLGMAVLARPAISIVLQHGALTARGARTTADALIAMALGVPTFCLFLVLMRCYQAMQDTRTMFVLYVVENVTNIFLDVALYPRFGIRGLAAGLALAYAVAAVAAFVHLSRRMGGLGGRRLTAAVGAVLTAAVAAAAAAWAVSWAIGRLPGGTRQIAIAARVLAGVIAGVTVYFLTARALGFDEVRKLLQLRRNPV